MKFEELDLSYDVLDALDAMSFEECTPIQEQTIPVILKGNDLVACAQTGTGKTAAYLLPVIDSIADGYLPDDAINCIVMAPTRELVQQIDRQMEGFAYFLPVSSLAIYGGTDGAEFTRQQRGLKMGADVVIATPGRLLDHIQMGYVDLSRVSYFILDEADRMLDMGFYDDIMQIVKRLPADRQTLLFSATMPQKTRRLADEILTDPVEVSIAISRPTEKIDQSAYVCHDGQKTAILKHIFKTRGSKRVIVFASSKLAVKDLTRELRQMRYKAAEMHSDLDQQKREEVIHDFASGKIDILVATDILARGIDIEDIAMVVNYNVPREAEDYIHRIGRTARAGDDGIAITLVNRPEQEKFHRIEKFLGYEIKKNEIPAELGDAPAYNPSERGGGGHRKGGHRGSNGRNSDRGGRKDRPQRDRKRQQPAAKTETPAPEAAQSEKSGQPRRNNRRRHNGRRRNNGTPDAGNRQNS